MFSDASYMPGTCALCDYAVIKKNELSGFNVLFCVLHNRVTKLGRYSCQKYQCSDEVRQYEKPQGR